MASHLLARRLQAGSRALVRCQSKAAAPEAPVAVSSAVKVTVPPTTEQAALGNVGE